MFDFLKDMFKCETVYKDSTGPQFDIDIKAPKDKIPRCIAVLNQHLYQDKGKGEWLCSNIGGDHFLVEVKEYSVYVEYLTVAQYESLSSLFNKGILAC